MSLFLLEIMEFVEKDAKWMSLEDVLRWLAALKTAEGLEQLVNCISEGFKELYCSF